MAIDEVQYDVQIFNELGQQRVSPNSGKKYYTPVVSQSVKPAVGMVFDSIEHAFSFYEKYALCSGFSIRRTSSYNPKGVIKLKYFVCSRQGFKKGRSFDKLHDGKVKRYRKPSKRIGCNAYIKLRLNVDKKYQIYGFQEEHNHSFVKKEDIQFLTSVRKVNYVKESAIQALSTINLGPVRAFNILKSLYGGYEDIGATKNDFKNFKMDLNVYIGEYDAEMVIQRLERKKQYCPNFSFDYTIKEDGTLGGLFWADEVSKSNYLVFGDVVGFDATYRSNKYDMVFVPFTSIDNHNRNVTLGAALLGSESAESYSWLLRFYVKAFGCAPKVIVTDQDPAMKKAIQEVLPNSRHRLCMWHIWEKLSAKLGPVVCNTTDFKKELAEIVWTDFITRVEFEERWHSIISHYGLSDHVWLSDIYNIRQNWIPVFYLEENLSGLMRTTSRSESENHFFNQFCNPKSTLVEFFSHFETAIEAQRYEHRKNDHESRYTEPDMWSKFVLEKQAAQIYTRTIFLDQQLEIDDAINSCASATRQKVGDFMKFEIEDLLQPCTSHFEVMFRNEDQTITCSCRRFEQFGLLCRHIFYVLRLCFVREFPKKYIVRRWRREAITNTSIQSVSSDDVETNGDVVEAVLREIRFANDYSINRLVMDIDQLCLYRDYVKGYMAKADEKRLKSAREIAISQAGKKTKECGFCKVAGHNLRTCKLYIASLKEKESPATSGVDNIQV
ncbi:hypothetical protein L1987_17822 [Smallanthus sonchifolius]|uniref:Uncharacterized protein n=1 Tax=Smallanthus sonchifolius TaxID=185202 RepID=A0ACB9J077_9ASTR|nr:hypothetical protein L1987_17822 [Smallanthus sonchifolius]